MKKLLVFLLVTLFLTSCGDSDEPVVVTMGEKLNGTWLLTSINGKSVYDNYTEVLELHILKERDPYELFGWLVCDMDGYPVNYQQDTFVLTTTDTNFTVEKSTVTKIVFKVLKVTADSLEVQTTYQFVNGQQYQPGQVNKYAKAKENYKEQVVNWWQDANVPHPTTGFVFYSDSWTYNYLANGDEGWQIDHGKTNCTYQLFGKFMPMNVTNGNSSSCNAWKIEKIETISCEKYLTMSMKYMLSDGTLKEYSQKLKSIAVPEG